MKILMAYDGSGCADEAIDDLTRAGLPSDTEAVIITVSETFIAPEETREVHFADSLGFSISETYKVELAATREKQAEAEDLNKRAIGRLRTMFPGWKIRGTCHSGFTERVILDEATKQLPDLIVLGSHGRGGLGRAFFGSVSLKVLVEAKCSVRIGRRSGARQEPDDSPLRIVVALDGSAGAQVAVKELLNRDFPPDTSFRVVSAIEPMPYTILLAEMPKAEEMRVAAAAAFREKGWHTSVATQFGRARNVIIDEAERWRADVIFIGAEGHGIFERVLLGSVSYSVSARSHCSVEIVRG